MKAQSLRARLIAIILLPLMLVAAAAAVWQYRNATQRAEEIFDRGLLSAALAISRDVALSDGDALSSTTRRLIGDTSGGGLFYHVFAPDGVFVTGYSTPPLPPKSAEAPSAEPLYFDAVYQGRNVRVLRFLDATTIDDVAGLFTISVWQDMGVRNAFVRDVASRSIAVIMLLLLSVALIVWFGVRLGLRPLLDLQEAIARRTPSELEPIRRNIPVEARGIVSTLNALLDRVSRRISSKDEFISNAAHQLRNPIAGVLALAEAVEHAPTLKASKARSAELVTAARDAAHLTNQLLSFERAKGSDTGQNGAPLDLCALIKTAASRFEAQQSEPALRVTLDLPSAPCKVFGDSIMLQEALLNLLTNAALHGGPQITEVTLSLTTTPAQALLRVFDDGRGIAPKDRILAKGRFSQAGAGPGTGLGLPIAAQVMENHGGDLVIEDSENGASFLLTLPLHRG
ncbi:sensor histidine kinase [Alphaproteobacteria bacterium KMM 3653]|uniref:histidine kinase n=1 Tax=Harenicola maris TaxID=2841044 RepID=A0AAP2G4N7_9RHOB|nr:sensor histidine kinase [Harenicola maris]